MTNLQITQEQAFQSEMSAARKGKSCVAIVGMAESTRELAPFDDLDVAIWGMNESAANKGQHGKPWLRRWTGWHQMHKLWDALRPNNQNDAEHPAWLRAATGFPIYMQEVFPEVPASVAYPKDEIVEKYLKNYRRIGDDGKPIEYFKSTAAYQLAHAGLLGFDRIEVYGVEMSFETEYKDQRPNFEFWCGIVGQHAEIIVPASCSLLGGPNNVRYGYDQKPRLNPTQFGIRAMAMRRDREGYMAKLQDLYAEKGVCAQQLKAFSGDATRVKGIRARLQEIEGEVDTLKGRANILQGAIQEAEFVLSTMGQLSGD